MYPENLVTGSDSKPVTYMYPIHRVYIRKPVPVPVLYYSIIYNIYGSPLVTGEGEDMSQGTH
jgi:hypothetical protein